MMKKLVVSLALALTLTACGSTSSASTEETSPAASASTPQQWPTEDNLPSGPSTVGIDQCDRELFSQDDAQARISQGWEDIRDSVGQDNHLDLINEFYDDVKAFDLASQPGCTGDLDLSFFRVSIANLKADVREGWVTEESYADAAEEYQTLMGSWQ